MERSSERGKGNIGGADLPMKNVGDMAESSYGADLGPTADNRIAGIGQSTRSDPAERDKPPGQRHSSVMPGNSTTADGGSGIRGDVRPDPIDEA